MAQDKAGRKPGTQKQNQNQQPTGKNWLLAIAIDTYPPEIGRLYNCVKDVKAFIELVTNKYNFDEKHIRLLTDEKATYANIQAALRKLIKDVKPEDNLVVYYSGHGDYDDDIDLGYWIPVDEQNRKQGLNNDYITRFLSSIKSRHTLLLCDSCFSGSLLLDSPTKNIGSRYYQHPSRWAITSGSKELVSDGKEHSPFAEALLNKLRQHQGDLNVLELGQAILENVAVRELQKPLFAPMRLPAHQGGMFVFMQRKNEEADWKIAEAENTILAYSRFRRKYRNSTHYEEAKQRIKALEEEAAWQKALRRNRVSDYEDYLDDYPNGVHAEEAHQRVEDILAGITIKPPKQEKPIITPPEDLEVPEPPRLDFEPEMVFVEGGTFMMGSNEHEREQPIHQVTLSDFYIGKYPVTQAQWQAVMGENPSKFKDCGNCPVENVSWDDVQEFIKKLNDRTGKNYRLPTEAEWEYAARGGNKSKGYKYSGSDNLDEVGWYGNNSGSKTHPVGQKKHNELGIYDMSGNVWEWCVDWYGDYPSEPQSNPTGPVKGLLRVLRGGSWNYLNNNCRVACRGRDVPVSRDYNFGFRFAQDK